MALSRKGRRYLRAFTAHAHEEGGNGWLHPLEAGERSGVRRESRELALRLEEQGLLRRSDEGVYFTLTRRGVHALLPWWERHPGIAIGAVAVVTIGLMIALALSE